MLTHKRTNIGDCDTGVTVHKPNGKFRVRVCTCDGRNHIGLYDTHEEASLVYKHAKLVELYKRIEACRSVIDETVYKTLMNYQLEDI